MRSALLFLISAGALILMAILAVSFGRAEKECRAMGGVYHHPHCFERGALIDMNKGKNNE